MQTRIKLANLINNSPWYYRLTRKVLGFDKILNQHNNLLNNPKAPKEGYHALNEMLKLTKEIHDQAAKHNRFSRWLLGFNHLIKGYESIAVEASEAFDATIVDKLSPSQHIVSSNKVIQANFANITKHLEEKQEFLKTIKKPEPETIPHSIGNMGSTYFNAPIKMSVSGGQPLTYQNLIKQKKETKRIMKHGRFLLNSQKNSPEWNKGSFYIDSGHGILYWIKNKLHLFTTRVEIDLNTMKPKVVYPSAKRI